MISESHFIDLEPGDLQSLPAPSSGTTRAQVMPTFSALDIAEKAKMAAGELFYEHKQLISGLNGRYVEECVISMKQDLIELASMSLFLSFNQIMVFRQLIFPTTNSDDPTGFSDTPPSAVLAFFVLSGAALDVLSALFALISLLSLRKTAKTIHEAKSQVCCAIWAAHDATRVPHYCHPDLCDVPARFPDDLFRLLHMMDYHSNFCFVNFLLFNAGMAFFSTSACVVAFLEMATLPVVVGISLTIFTISMNVLMVVGVMRTGRYWRKFFSYVASSFRTWLDSTKKPVLGEKPV